MATAHDNYTQISRNDPIAADYIQDGGVASGVSVLRTKMGYGSDGRYQELPFPQIAAARGLYDDIEIIRQFGRNNDVGTGTAETIWDGGATWVAPATGAEHHNIASTEAADAAGSTGAREVTLYGLDDEMEQRSEVVVMNGTNDVLSSISYRMLYRMVVTSAGSGGENAGVITATAQASSTVTSQISAGMGQALMAIYAVPRNFFGYILGFYASINKSGGQASTADILLFSKNMNPDYATPAKRLKHIFGLQTTGTSMIYHVFGTPISIPEMELTWIEASVTANGTDISAGFDIVLLKNA